MCHNDQKPNQTVKHKHIDNNNNRSMRSGMRSDTSAQCVLAIKKMNPPHSCKQTKKKVFGRKYNLRMKQRMTHKLMGT